MKRKAEKPETDKEEELLLQKATEKRVAREERCVKAMNEILAKHKCQLQLYVHIGEQKIPINAVLALPTSVGVNSLK